MPASLYLAVTPDPQFQRPLVRAGLHSPCLLAPPPPHPLARIDIDWTKFGLAAAPARVRDAIAGKDLGAQGAPYGVTGPAEDLVVVTIAGEEMPATLHAASDADNERIGHAAAEACASCFRGALIAIGGNRALVFHNVRTATGQRLVRVNYRNASSTTVIGRLMVNGVQSTGVAFPPTGKELRSVTLRLELNDANRPNALEFGAPCGAELWLESVEALSW
ncbi:MAG: hypothetical protein P4K98_05480 [Bryobacteraceae bacterium]|nr:hypothetical protein [Bryobacteraceae bacterium]